MASLWTKKSDLCINNSPSTHPTFLPTGGPDGSGALGFDGVDDDGFAFNVWSAPLNGDISIDFSMRPDSLPDLNGDNFMGLVSVTPMNIYLIDDGSGTGQVLALTFDSNGNPTFGFSQGGLTLGQWHEVQAQVVDGTLNVEVDGITTSYTLGSGVLASSSEPAAVFGRDMSSLTRYFDGALDEIRIATAPYAGIPGDFDADGDVDGHDFLVWQQGDSPNGATLADLTLWQNAFGVDDHVGAGVAPATVPEPASALLILLGVESLAATRQRHTPDGY